MGGYTAALSFVGQNVAKGALSYVGGDIAGWALSSIFGGSSGPSNQDILDAVSKLGTQLTAIQNTLNVLLQDVNANFTAIESTIKAIQQQELKIQAQQLYDSWNNVNVPAFEIVSRVNTQYDTFVAYQVASKTTTQGEVTDLVSAIQDTNSGARVSLDQLNTSLLGAGGSKGLLELWFEMVQPLFGARLMGLDEARNAYLTYYLQIVSAQMRAASLLEEAYNQQNNNPVARAEYAHYRELVTGQEIPFLTVLEELLYANVNQGALWDNYGGGGTEKQLVEENEYHSAVQELYAGAAFPSTFYRPSYWRMQAEQIAACGQCMHGKERRIAVWMVYDSQQTGSGSEMPPGNYDNASVQICTVGNPSAPISPDSVATLVTQASYALFREPSTGPKPHLVRRNLFTSISDGTYTLYDMNSQYPPILGSGRQTYFIWPHLYLTHRIVVGPGAPMDSMDFLAWASYQWILRTTPSGTGGKF